LSIEKVNSFLDEKRFVTRPPAYFEKSEDFEGFNLYPVDGEKLAEVLESGKRKFFFEETNGGKHLTLMVPVQKSAACDACHGYDSTSIRGVIRISMPTIAMDTQLKSLLWVDQVLISLGVALGVVLLFAFYVVTLLKKVREGEEQMRISANVYENTIEGIMITEANADIVSVNPAFTRISGYSAEEIKGQNPRILKSGRHDEAFYKEMWKALTEKGKWVGEIWNKRKNGEVYAQQLSISAIKDDKEQVSEYVAVAFDVTEKKKQEEIIRFMAYNDNLTSLPNRNTFNSLLKVELAHAKRYDHKVAVMFLDLDGFKQVNDTYGHNIGDGLLKNVAEKLTASIREGDTVARIGGDEFTILLPRITKDENAQMIATKIISLFSNPIEIDTHSLKVGASIGIAIFPRDGEDPETLLKNADEAMYRAKQGGKNRLEMYSKQTNGS
jgi:diguanylate cyclase (GGDEF)-like protein/PAS domain S-box-containing protein